MTINQQIAAELSDEELVRQIGTQGEAEFQRVLRADALRRIREGKTLLLAHTKAVGDFLNDLYAIMVDPLAQGTIQVADTCSALKEAALASREFEHKHQNCPKE